MKQPMIKITDDNGKDYGYKKIMSMNWDNYGHLRMIAVDFIESRDRSESPTFYDYDNTGVFTNTHGNLKGKLIIDF